MQYPNERQRGKRTSNHVFLPLFIYVGYDTRGNPFLISLDETGEFRRLRSATRGAAKPSGGLCAVLPLISLRVHSRLFRITSLTPAYIFQSAADATFVCHHGSHHLSLVQMNPPFPLCPFVTSVPLQGQKPNLHPCPV